MTNIETMRTILEKIKSYQRIMIFRHIRPDGDCMGASKGLKEILKTTYSEKEIILTDDAHSDYLAFLGPDDEPVPDETYASALGIVVDVGGVHRISNQKYALCKELIKIDHHIELEPYGGINWVEDQRSSACEMIVAFWDAFRDELKMTPKAAWYLYTGMVTDSGRFRFEGVTGDTLRYAAMLLDQGVDTQTLYAHLYLKEYQELKFQAYVLEHMERTENGVATIYVTEEMQKTFGLNKEAASACVSHLEGIKGCLCWLAFIDNLDEAHTIRVRVRSRFLPTNGLAERYHGGGHAMASGATVYSVEEMRRMIADADALVKDYKAHNDGWL